MAIRLDDVFSAGGRDLIQVLTHCVYSVNTDALFAYLSREYRFRPQAQAAIALFDVFCVPHSYACIHERSMIAPSDARLAREIESMRMGVEAFQHRADAVDPIEFENADSDSPASAESSAESSEHARIPGVLPIPPQHLFEPVVQSLYRSPASRIKQLEAGYDLQKTPLENLPAGKMSMPQRAFVDNVWGPKVRPFLVSAGFWRIATIG